MHPNRQTTSTIRFLLLEWPIFYWRLPFLGFCIWLLSVYSLLSFKYFLLPIKNKKTQGRENSVDFEFTAQYQEKKDHIYTSACKSLTMICLSSLVKWKYHYKIEKTQSATQLIVTESKDFVAYTIPRQDTLLSRYWCRRKPMVTN